MNETFVHIRFNFLYYSNDHVALCFVTMEQTILSKALMVTTPAYVAADILGNPAAVGDSADRTSAVLPAAAELNTINYPPVAAVTLAYPTAAFKVCVGVFLCVCCFSFPIMRG